MSESAEEFATRMKGLARHARDEHDWGFGRCDFHQLRVCSCGECEDGEDLKCEGTDYQRMMDVGRQSNGSDCGVLALAFAYDICGNDPCKIKYDHRSMRQYLAECLEKCHLSRFPTVGERRTVGVRLASSPGLLRGEGEGRPGIHCMRMRYIFRIIYRKVSVH